jgi:hypothetical protein
VLLVQLQQLLQELTALPTRTVMRDTCLHVLAQEPISAVQQQLQSALQQLNLQGAYADMVNVGRASKDGAQMPITGCLGLYTTSRVSVRSGDSQSDCMPFNVTGSHFSNQAFCHVCCCCCCCCCADDVDASSVVAAAAAPAARPAGAVAGHSVNRPSAAVSDVQTSGSSGIPTAAISRQQLELSLPQQLVAHVKAELAALGFEVGLPPSIPTACAGTTHDGAVLPE